MDPKEIVNQEIALWCAFTRRVFFAIYSSFLCGLGLYFLFFFFFCAIIRPTIGLSLQVFYHGTAYPLGNHDSKNTAWSRMLLLSNVSTTIEPSVFIQRVYFPFLGKCVYCRFSMYFISLFAFDSLIPTILYVVSWYSPNNFYFTWVFFNRIVWQH